MDPVALEKAFEIYPDVKLVVMAHLYGSVSYTHLVSLRAQFGALNPTDFMPLAIIATSCASIGGLALDRWVNYRGK